MWKSTASEVPGICILCLSERVLGIGLDCCQISAGSALGCHLRCERLAWTASWHGKAFERLAFALDIHKNSQGFGIESFLDEMKKVRIPPRNVMVCCARKRGESALGLSA